ncbi:glycosyltransferase family 39 protein [Desulfobacterales bacterium HSG2]|nr:glycosyltransferase family 39 protein [Desulfobacterales bacterium HSG2]
MSKNHFKNISKKKAAVIFSICVICILTRLLFSGGFRATTDHAEYSKAACEISEFNLQVPTNHWNGRIGNTFSIALFYFIFGVNEYSAIGAELLFSVLNIFLVFLLSQEIFEGDNSFKIGATASVLLTFVPISIETGSMLTLVHGQIFFMFSSIYFLFRGERQGKPYYYAISGLCVGIAYLFHETGVFALFIIATHLIAKRKFDKTIFIILFASFLVFACENLIYYFETGTFFHRQIVTLKTHLHVEGIDTASDLLNINTDSDIMRLKTKFKARKNLFSGTFIGDSWLLEPFRYILMYPAYSVIYHLFFLISIFLIIKKDEHVIYLNLLFWTLFLYYSYGSQTPLSYKPLVRLPRYILPCLIPVCIAVGYGIDRILKQKYLQNMLIIFFIFISLFCTSIKGGDIGQKFYQCKFFYKFIKENPDKQFVTDSVTFIGLEFLSKYQGLSNVRRISFRNFIQKVNNTDFLKANRDSYVFINLPETYRHASVNFDASKYVLIAQYNRKPRKICLLPGIQNFLKDNLCDLSNGGKIYKIRKPLQDGA